MNLPILSYTFLSAFENCPHKAWHRHVLKDLPFQSTPELEYGRDVHDALEHRLTRGTAIEPELAAKTRHYCDLIERVQGSDAPVRIEHFVGIMQDGFPCAWDHSGCWFRGKADVAIIGKTGWLIDWKTGKKREDPFELECQAMLLAAHYPGVVKWEGEYFWLKEEHPYGLRHTLDPMRTLQRVKALYTEVVKYAQAQQEWPKRKNPLCGWCDVISCENNKKRNGDSDGTNIRPQQRR